ncbi:r2r3-MYB transcription factor [Tritrichomonas foetus]|uniref:R2r3-MYB transcription factor n=1 Tax=Tritrichomonas foetus TaxID=1144522 RepID=A0A1J4KTT9_9EUKA|nr:r2r3-MYB transcription factor [Tritrichomonas foetus]|eukprot:OHT14328.1 r2r3-MYB transcription factor [Tritrichomonas foetus]
MHRTRGRHFFSKQEDKLLKRLVDTVGAGNWSEIAKRIPGRTPKQCRDRYVNYLKSNLQFQTWTTEDDELLIKLFHQHGARWATIAQIMKTRSENEIKNHWYRYLTKRMSEDRLDSVQKIPEEGQTPVPIQKSEEIELINVLIDEEMISKDNNKTTNNENNKKKKKHQNVQKKNEKIEKYNKAEIIEQNEKNVNQKKDKISDKGNEQNIEKDDINTEMIITALEYFHDPHDFFF